MPTSVKAGGRMRPRQLDEGARDGASTRGIKDRGRQDSCADTGPDLGFWGGLGGTWNRAPDNRIVSS